MKEEDILGAGYHTCILLLISAMEEEKTYTGQQVNTGAPLTVEKDDKCKLQILHYLYTIAMPCYILGIS